MSLAGSRRKRTVIGGDFLSPSATSQDPNKSTTANTQQSMSSSSRRRPVPAVPGVNSRPLSSLLDQLADFNLDEEQDTGSSQKQKQQQSSSFRSPPSPTAPRPEGPLTAFLPGRRYDRSAAPSPPSSANGRYERSNTDSRRAPDSFQRSASERVPLSSTRVGGMSIRERSPGASRSDRGGSRPTAPSSNPKRAPIAVSTKNNDRKPNNTNEDDDNWLLGDAAGAGALADLLSKSRSKAKDGASASGRSVASERSGRSAYTSRSNGLRSAATALASQTNISAREFSTRKESPLQESLDTNVSIPGNKDGIRRPAVDTSPISSSPHNLTAIVPESQLSTQQTLANPPDSPLSLPNGSMPFFKYNDVSATGQSGFRTPLMQMIASTRLSSPFLNRQTHSGSGDIGLFRRNSQKTTSSSASATIDLFDPKVIQQLVNTALADCDGFQMMQLDKLEDKRRQIISYTSQVGSLQNKIALESRIREAAESFMRSGVTDPNQINTARQQLIDTTRKMEDIAADTWKTVFNLVETERIVFMHISAVLRWQMLEQQQATNAYPDGSAKRAAEELVARKKLASAESRVREMEQHVDVLKLTVSRLESEQEPLRRVAADAQRSLRHAREERSILEASMQFKDDQPSQFELNRLKLDLATCRADLTDAKEELSSKKDLLANLQLQLEDDQSLIESKDRMISNLLGELEEANTQLEMVHAGGNVSNDHRRTSVLLRAKDSSASNNGMNRALGEQLKQAVLEQEKLKLQQVQDREHIAELQTKLRTARSTSSRRTRRGNGSSTAGPVSESETDTEEGLNSRYGRPRGIIQSSKSARSPMFSESEFKDVQRKNDEQADLIQQLKSRGNGFTEMDEKLLCEINSELEVWVGATSPRSIPTLSRNKDAFSPTGRTATGLPSMTIMITRFRSLLDHDKYSTQRIQELMAQKKSMEQSLEAVQGNLHTTNMDSDSKFSDLRREYGTLQDQLATLTTRLHDSERTATELQGFKLKMEETSRKLEVAELELERVSTELKNKIASADRELLDMSARQQDKWDSDMKRIKDNHQLELNEVQSYALEETKQVTKRLEREIEQIKASTDQRIQEAIEIELSSVTRKHQYELEDLNRQHALVKTTLEAKTIEDNLEIRRRLETAEDGLVTSKQQFFVERERLQERLDQAQEESRTLRAMATERSNEWIAKKRELDEAAAKVAGERDALSKQLDQTLKELEDTNKKIAEANDRHVKEIESIREANDKKVSELQASLEEYQSLQAELAQIEKSTNQQLQAKEVELERLAAVVAEEKRRAISAIEQSQEAQADADDQLHRFERLRREAERDVDRYRKLAEEKDEEVLSLKKLLRQKEKEISSSISGGSAASPGSTSAADSVVRNLLEQKDRDIDALRKDTRAASTEIALLKHKVELKEREIDDFKAEMRRRAQIAGDKDAQSEEVDRLQIMLMELKTSRAQLLEDLDNREHVEHVLRAEITTLKSKLASDG
ncbi:hypothetical protein MT418_003829 [Batrachochytrium dendrobatidis]